MSHFVEIQELKTKNSLLEKKVKQLMAELESRQPVDNSEEREIIEDLAVWFRTRGSDFEKRHAVAWQKALDLVE